MANPRSCYDQNFLQQYNPLKQTSNMAEFYMDPMKYTYATRPVQRTEYDLNMLQKFNGYIPSKDEMSEYYVPLDKLCTSYNNPNTGPITRSDRDVEYNAFYNNLALNSGNMAEFYRNDAASNFLPLKNTWTRGYYGKNMYNVKNNLKFNEKAMTGRRVPIQENFNYTPANTRLTTEDPDNIYSYPIFTSCDKNCRC